jgi:hypothetical protein
MSPQPVRSSSLIPKTSWTGEKIHPVPGSEALNVGSNLASTPRVREMLHPP